MADVYEVQEDREQVDITPEDDNEQIEITEEDTIIPQNE